MIEKQGQLNQPTKEKKVETDRNEIFYAQYEKQGITIETVKILIDKLQRLLSDPQSVSQEIAPEVEKLHKIRDEKQKEYDALYHELNKAESNVEDLENSDEEDEYDQAVKEFGIIREKYRDCSREMDGLGNQLRELRDLMHSYARGKFTHFESFYRSASDSLSIAREQVDVKDKKITTVASNGDLWQVFADQEAKEIDVFDLSLPALFYSELKLIGLENLDFKEYLQMFGQGKEDLRKQQKKQDPFFDPDQYNKIKDKLSPQARCYFDSLVGDIENTELICGGGLNGFVRYRPSDVFVGDIITDEKEYQKLQQKTSSVRFNFRLGDIRDLYTEKELEKFDVIYLSNIGYMIRSSLELAKSLLKTPKQQGIVSTSLSRLQHEDYLYDDKLRTGKEIETGATIDNHFNLDIKFLGSAGVADGETILSVSLLDSK
jgi:hypothetical protein